MNLTFLLPFVEVFSQATQLSDVLLHIAKYELQREYFHTVIYMKSTAPQDDEVAATETGDVNEFASKILENFNVQLNVPIFLLNREQHFLLFRKNNDKYFIIAELTGNQQLDWQMLDNLWRTLRANQQNRMVFLLNDVIDEEYLRMLMQYCSVNKSQYVIAFSMADILNNQYYTFKLFPEFEMLKMPINIPVDGGDIQEYQQPSLLYINHLENMYGHPLRILMTVLEPKSFYYYNEKGEIVLSGYIGKYVVEFARKHNATLEYPLMKELGDLIPVQDTQVCVLNGTCDMSMAATSFSFDANLTYSTIYESMDWCLMFPLEKPLPSQLYYLIIFDLITLLLTIITIVALSLVLSLTYMVRGQYVNRIDLLFNTNLMNGLLGQSINMEITYNVARRIIYLVTTIAGLIFNTSFVTYLQTFNTQPPTEAPFTSFDNILMRNMKIVTYSIEKVFLSSTLGFGKYDAMFLVYDQLEDYIGRRDAMDTRYAYPVPSANWLFYKQKQLFFSKPLFHISNLCFLNNLPMVLPFQESSLYLKEANKLISHLNQGGLIEYWQQSTFLEMVQLKRYKLEDLSKQNDFEPMTVQDLYYVLLIGGLAWFISIFCFAMELLFNKRAYILQKIRRTKIEDD